MELMGMIERALEKFIQATEGITEPVQAIFYNDPQPDKIVYQGLAWLKLGYPKKAEKYFIAWLNLPISTAMMRSRLIISLFRFLT